MSPRTKPPAPPFNLAERAWLRQELSVHVGAPSQIADGFFLRSWKSSTDNAKPRLPPAAQSMLERALHGGTQRHASSVKHLPDQARRLGLV